MASFIKTSSLQLYLKRDSDSRGISVVEIHCIAIRINFMNLLKSVGSVGSVSAWVRGFMGSMSQIFAEVVGKTYDFTNFCYDCMKFYCFKL